MKKKIRSSTRPQCKVLPLLQTGMKKLLTCFKGGWGGWGLGSEQFLS